MKRIITVVGAVALSGSLVACGSQEASTSTTTPKPQTLTFQTVEQPGNMTVENLSNGKADNVGLGNLIAFTQTLMQRGAKVGEVHLAGIGTTNGHALTEANATLVLKDGNIQVAGIVPEQPTFTLAVVGGTGTYAGRTGSMTFNLGNSVPTLTVHLR